MRRRESGFCRDADVIASEKHIRDRSRHGRCNHLLVSCPVRDVRTDIVRLNARDVDSHQDGGRWKVTLNEISDVPS